MNAIGMLSSQAWVERFGWTLVHFLWQGAAIACVYAIGRACVARANARYLLGCLALAFMLVAPLITWSALPSPRALPDPAYRINSVPPVPAAISSAASSPAFLVKTAAIAGAPPAALWSWVVASWFLGALAFWLRLAGGWVIAARMRSRLVHPAPPEWQRTLRTLGARIGVTRPVRFLVSAIVEAPTVIGWLRPTVLVPVGALTGLPPGHLEAVLAHELAHIQRHDYLVNVVQTIAEALLFYHPAVWWVSGHIRNERELCCDDAAVSVSGDVLTYARALMELESCRPAHLDAVLAANGGSLADRIARLLGARAPLRGGNLGAGVAAAAVLLGVLAGGAACGLFGQSSAHPAFQVASIKQNTANPQRRGVRVLPGGQLSAENATLQLLILNAYTVQRFQLMGGPSWVESDGYDVVAKPEAPVDRNQALLMLQTLLADRFSLKVHRETKDVPVYELTAAKGGLKLPPPVEGSCVTVADGAPPAPLAPPQPGSRPVIPCGRPIIGFSGMLNAGKITMADLAQGLASIMGRPVLDRTGFTGQFDVHLTFAPDQAAVGLAPPPGLAPPSVAPPSDSDRPSIFAALQEQLGLRLASAKGPAEVLVIDHVERPSEN
jgi:uncharacterized protein (TIGR03435 family)